MSKIKCERGRTLVYPGMYPRLLVTPVFAHEGDFMWIEKIVCMYDSCLDDVEEPEFEFHRDTAHYEKNDALQAENAKLLEIIADLKKMLPKSERLRSAVSDDADNACDVLAENAKLRKLLLDVWNDAMRFDGFWDYVNDDGEIYNEDELPHYKERMRELGIEVDE